MKYLVPFLVLSTGCALDASSPDVRLDEAPAAPPAEHADPFFRQLSPGFSVIWSQLTGPSGVRTIAACGAVNGYHQASIWALDELGDLSVSINPTDGLNPPAWGTWALMQSGTGTLGAPLLQSIACDGYNLYALDANKTLWSTSAIPAPGQKMTWTNAGNPWEAQYITGGPGTLFAVNTNGALYQSDAVVNGQQVGFQDPEWQYDMGIASAISSVTAVQAMDFQYFGSNVRLFGLNGGVAQYNDNASVAPSGSPVRQIGWADLPGHAPALVQLAAGLSGTGIQFYGTQVLYGLDTSNALWQGTIAETDCGDGVDNDDNSVADFFDPACYTPVMTQLCNQLEASGVYAGNLCFSRANPGDTAMLARCVTGIAPSFEDGNGATCIQEAAPGTDKFGPLPPPR